MEKGNGEGEAAAGTQPTLNLYFTEGRGEGIKWDKRELFKKKLFSKLRRTAYRLKTPLLISGVFFLKSLWEGLGKRDEEGSEG